MSEKLLWKFNKFWLCNSTGFLIGNWIDISKKKFSPQMNVNEQVLRHA